MENNIYIKIMKELGSLGTGGTQRGSSTGIQGRNQSKRTSQPETEALEHTGILKTMFNSFSSWIVSRFPGRCNDGP
jgi:hypothetical protein